MKKRALAKDIRKSFSKSMGRFLSILCLIALGSFALVGLQVAGPDMRATGRTYFEKLNVADIAILGDYGIDKENCATIDRVSGARSIEYGYLKDAVVEGSLESFRIFSRADELSQYEVVSGRLPKGDDEIALASFFEGEYALGDTITFAEKADMSGNKVLRHEAFKVVGFVNSGEIICKTNLGQSTAGTGELKGYAVVTPEAFDSEFFMIARIAFADTEGMDPYSDEYAEKIQAHKDELNRLLADAPGERLQAIRAQYQEQIDEGQAELDEAKQQYKDAKQALADANDALEAGRAEIAAAKREVAAKSRELKEAEAAIAASEPELSAAQQELTQKQQEYDAAYTEFSEKKQQLAKVEAVVNVTEKGLQASRNALERRKTAYETEIAALQAEIDSIEAQLSDPGTSLSERAELTRQLARKEAQKKLKESEQQTFLNQTYQTGMAAVEEGQRLLDEQVKEQLKPAQQELAAAEAQLSAAKKQLDDGKAQLSAAEKQLADAKAQVEDGRTQLAVACRQIARAETRLSGKDAEYQAALTEFEEKRPEVEAQIAEAEGELADARAELAALTQPAYAMDTRRELPGSEGYRIYASVAEIVDELAKVFPIFLYFVAALVTLTTMTRFVDEERINSGTLKGLGYENRDIIKKFTAYGLASSLLGVAVGVAAGHTLLPMIVYHAYGDAFTLPRVEFHFYWQNTLVATALALISAVLPAYIVAAKNLCEKPAALLQPKPPANGSKILLEHITPIWNHMTFTQKVTARNIFRYKKRMFMTIFGVCGSVTLLFAGLSMQHSISGVKDRQFGDILKYDMIVAKDGYLSDAEKEELDGLLSSGEVEKSLPIYYEAVTKAAGKKMDKQEVKMIAADGEEGFSQYIGLVNRKSGEAISLSGDGAVLSERLAELLDVQVGDRFTVMDAENQEREMTVAGITEMYTGHFLFLDAEYYAEVFDRPYAANAYVLTLEDGSNENAETVANTFMACSGVKGIVQNTTMKKQIDTIVESLNQIMDVLILVSSMLAIVILYNLTNINVSERIRELSTIKVLGFYDKEVTMYIYRETIFLTILGVLTGFLTGDLFYQYMLRVVPPEEVMFNPALGAKAFIAPVLVVGVITVVLGKIINGKLKRVDMLEALKSVE